MATKTNADGWLDAALNNQEVPEVAQMYAQISIALSLQRIADAAEDVIGAIKGDDALGVREVPWK